MPRKKRPLDRDGGALRDASLIVIASEDTYAVKDYFLRFRTRRVQFFVIPTEGGRSSPDHVIERLNKFKEETATEEGDQFWLCIDTDHWANSGHIANLTQVLRHCKQKNYLVAISKPCFDLWLLLHFEDVAPADSRTCREIAQRLSELVEDYGKKSCDQMPLKRTMVSSAVERAQRLDTGNSLIPETASTAVYKIIVALRQRDAIELI
jgi:hypothetical protein